jgi:hypothetical protein
MMHKMQRSRNHQPLETAPTAAVVDSMSSIPAMSQVSLQQHQLLLLLLQPLHSTAPE